MRADRARRSTVGVQTRSADVRSDTGVDGSGTAYCADVVGRAAKVAAEFARMR
jgi:hypothetical protein